LVIPLARDMPAQRTPAEWPRSADAVPPDFQSEGADSTRPSQVLQKLRKMVGEAICRPDQRWLTTRAAS
jgi:hypothetical protein